MALHAELGGTRGFFVMLVTLVALQRLAELALARRNEREARRRGGREAGASHYPFMVALHALFLVCVLAEVLLLERPFRVSLAAPMLGLLAAASALRVWVIRTLGWRWTTRVIVVPGLQAVRAGPYRWMRHPNYLAVALEIAALPLVHGAWLSALVFSGLNALMMIVRIRCEESALAEHAAYREVFGRGGEGDAA